MAAARPSFIIATFWYTSPLDISYHDPSQSAIGSREGLK